MTKPRSIYTNLMAELELDDNRRALVNHDQLCVLRYRSMPPAPISAGHMRPGAISLGKSHVQYHRIVQTYIEIRFC